MFLLRNWHKLADVKYVCQETPETNRSKPWGTGHAILTAKDAVDERFCVINADDFYGADAFRQMTKNTESGNTDFSMIGFLLKNTLSDFGAVSRGECFSDDGDFLDAVIERTGILSENGSVFYEDAAHERIENAVTR